MSKLSKRRQIQVIYTNFEDVKGSVEPWLMARWKARVEFLLSVIELLFVYPMHLDRPSNQFFRLSVSQSVCVFVDRSVVERLRQQFFTDFHEILHAAQKCGRFVAYCW